MSITWNGVSSDTIGVIVERIPNRYIPARRISPQQVAGRNGNILLVDKAFPNVEQEYEVYLSAESQGLPSVARACAEWLMGPDGYCRLTDSYDTTVYREAFLMGGFDLENILNKFGRCTITFSCKPQKFLLTGDTPVTIPAGHTDTYSGSLVTFTGASGSEISSLSVAFNPVQDLNGYTYPWGAGGGVNQWDCEYERGNILSDGSDGTSQNYNRTKGYVPVTGGEEYRVVCPTVNKRIYWYDADKAYISNDLTQNEVKTAPATAAYARMYWPKNDVPDPSTTCALNNPSSVTVWTPYSNICPITGLIGLSVYVSPTQDVADATEYAEDWTSQAGTVYGGTVDVVTGLLTATMANIASYNGETIGEPWLSSMDEYSSGATPTTGAQVVYTLDAPMTYQLTPQDVELLIGQNNVWSGDGSVSVAVSFPLGGSITNPTPFEARPLLTVSGYGELVVNGKSIQILEAVSSFKIDCDAMEADDNSKIYCMDFPELSGGANSVIGSGTITALSIVPRWWTL